jgi:hypothetical protein
MAPPQVRIEVFKFFGGWTWRVTRADGSTIAKAVRRYPEKIDCLAEIEVIRRAHNAVPIVFLDEGK